MIIKTEGFVFHAIKYSESSVIAHIYTKDYGIGSYIMNNVRGKRSKAAYFQPFSHVSFAAYKKDDANIHRIKEIQFKEIFVDLYADIAKVSLTQFLGEFLYKTVHSEEPNLGLYSFLEQKITELETTDKTGDFHIRFLMQLMSFFGVRPENNYSKSNQHFDVTNGFFREFDNVECLSLEDSYIIHLLLSDEKFALQKEKRSKILNIFLQYYKEHVHNFGTLKSLDVFQTIFS